MSEISGIRGKNSGNIWEFRKPHTYYIVENCKNEFRFFECTAFLGFNGK